MQLLIMQSSPTSRHFHPLGPNILLSTLFSDTLNLYSPLSVRYQIPHPYRTICKMIVLYLSFPLSNGIGCTCLNDVIICEPLWQCSKHIPDTNVDLFLWNKSLSQSCMYAKFINCKWIVSFNACATATVWFALSWEYVSPVAATLGNLVSQKCPQDNPPWPRNTLSWEN
jgi:hypothetical protein